MRAYARTRGFPRIPWRASECARSLELGGYAANEGELCRALSGAPLSRTIPQQRERQSEANTLTLATRSATAEDDMAGAGPSDLGMASDDVHAGLQPSTIIYQGKKGYKMVRHYLMGDMLGEGAQGKVKEAGALPHLALGRCSASP